MKNQKVIFSLFLYLFYLILFINSIDPNQDKSTKINLQEKLKLLPPLLKNQIYVGYSKKCIDPKVGPIMLAGFFPRPADINNQHYKISLYETLVMFMDKHGSMSILVTIDIIRMTYYLSNRIKIELSDKFGIPAENVTISATHSHSTPNPSLTSQETMYKYFELIINQIFDSFKEALEDLTPAYAYVGSTKVILENGKNALNFVRHYYTNNKDKLGRPISVGPNHGRIGWNGTHFVKTDYVNHTNVADNELHLIRFDFNLFKKIDVILANFRAHCTIMGETEEAVISADWVAGFRDSLEKNKTCRVAYFAGAGGDNIPNTYIDIGEGVPGITHRWIVDPTKPQDLLIKERALEYGRILSEYALKIYNNKNLKQVRLGNIINSNTIVQLNYALFSGEVVKYANYALKFWNVENSVLKQLICGTYSWDGGFEFPKGFDKTGKKIREIIRENNHILKNYLTVTDEGTTCEVNFIESDPVSLQYSIIEFIGAQYEKIPIYSPYMAERISLNSKYKEGDYKNISISAFNIGDISFASAPYEMFHANGKYIKDNSKTEMTFVLTQANGDEGYIPSEFSYEYGCYETDYCQYKKGCGESFAKAFTKIINDNYEYNDGGNNLKNLIFFVFLLIVLSS